MPQILLRPALVVCFGDGVEIIWMHPANEPHQRVVFNCRWLGVVDSGLLGQGFQRFRHRGSDGFKPKVWLVAERVGSFTLVEDDAMLFRLDSGLCAGFVFVRENRAVLMSLEVLHICLPRYT